MITVGVIATFIGYARRFFEPIRSLAELYNLLQAALAGAERIFALLDARPLVTDKPGAPALPEIRGHVVFDDVSFCYEEGVPVLQDISLVAEPGQTIALVGPTGAGKTTTVNLLARFYDVNKGRILIDGRDIRDVQQDSLRRQLGIVLQEPFLYSRTIRENIGITKDSICIHCECNTCHSAYNANPLCCLKKGLVHNQPGGLCQSSLASHDQYNKQGQ